GRAKLHADIAHPINSGCREVIQTAVLKAFQEERERAKQPGYVCTYDDFDGEYEGTYTQVVGELNGPGRGGPNYRPHPAHAPRRAGGHPPARRERRPPAAGRDEARPEGLGAGILGARTPTRTVRDEAAPVVPRSPVRGRAAPPPGLPPGARRSSQRPPSRRTGS